MKKTLLLLASFCAFSLSSSVVEAADADVLARLKGRILLQVESHGEAWYVNPADGLRYYMKDGAVAYSLMREKSLGITNRDLASVPSVSDAALIDTKNSVCTSNSLARRVKGQILLQVEAHGEAWYVDPDTCYRVYMKNGEEAYKIMRLLSLGITNEDLGRLASHENALPASSPVAGSGSGNPFIGMSLYTSGDSAAARQIKAWGGSEPANAAILEKIAREPMSNWFGEWNSDVRRDVDRVVTAANAVNAMPVLVPYNIPARDCGSYSAGGLGSARAYHDWISAFAEGIGDRAAVVILEPDAVADRCFNDERASILADAVATINAKSDASIYIDAGNANWTSAGITADRLTRSGVASTQGFALNVSNFLTTEQNTKFGNEVSALTGGKHYVIDVSRNGNGWHGDWCNPQTAAIGTSPTTNTGNALLDALLWVKPPGESDGACNGGPVGGAWWLEYALHLVNNAK